MAKEKRTKRIDLAFPYARGVVLRRSGMSKSAWEYVVHKFGIIVVEPEQISSITIEGEDDFGHLLISIMVDVKEHDYTN